MHPKWVYANISQLLICNINQRLNKESGVWFDWGLKIKKDNIE
jgi:hypothetical protein